MNPRIAAATLVVFIGLIVISVWGWWGALALVLIGVGGALYAFKVGTDVHREWINTPEGRRFEQRRRERTRNGVNTIDRDR